MTALPAYIQELDFEDWLARSERVTRITQANISRLVTRLTAEEDRDSFAVSPAYYAFTGRRGLWLYAHQDTFVPICWHPNIDGRLLVFPPRGAKNYDAIAALLDEAPAPAAGFQLARFNPADIPRLKSLHEGLHGISCKPIEETVLDWRYPVRILSTRAAAEMHGSDYMLIRNRVRQTQKYQVDVRPLSPEHVAAVEDLSRRWANRQTKHPKELADLVTPYRETLRMLKQKALALDGLVFVVDGVIQGAAIWDVSNGPRKTANLYMNLCNVTCRGLPEFLIKATAEKLHANGIPFLNLGGSETAGLDRFKNKFAPVASISLCSLEAKAPTPLLAANTELASAGHTPSSRLALG